MALPTVSYHHANAATDSSLLAVVMTQLHDMLDGAGWTPVHADSDAIGAGSLAAPAWDKTPTTNTNAGSIVYQMPANGHSVQWFVKLTPKWGSSSSGWGVHFQAGQSHNGSGTVTVGSASIEPTPPGVNKSFAWQMNASEDFFALTLLGASQNFLLFVERVRTYDGTVTDGLCAHYMRAAGTSQAGFVLDPAGGVVYSSDSSFPPAILAANQGNAWGALTASSWGGAATGDALGEIAFPVGPYYPSHAGLFGPPRCLAVFMPGDNLGLSNGSIPIDVDGGVKSYIFAIVPTAASDPYSGSAGAHRTALASE